MRHFVNHFLTRFLRVASASGGGGEHDARAVMVDFAFDLQVCAWLCPVCNVCLFFMWGVCACRVCMIACVCVCFTCFTFCCVIETLLSVIARVFIFVFHFAFDFLS